MTGNSKGTSLLHYGINFDRKKFYDTDPCLTVCLCVRLSVANALGSELKPARLSTDIQWSVCPSVANVF
jgi:hypothetical protein